MNRLNCDQVDWVLRSSPLEQISEEQLRAIEEHLGNCALCRELWQTEFDRRLEIDVPCEKVTPLGPKATYATWVQDYKRYFVVGTALVVFLVPFFYACGMAREAARRADSQAAMKTFGLICKRYANVSKNENWPALASTDNLWVPEMEPLHDAVSTNIQCMVSVYHPENTRLKGELAEAWSQSPPDFAKAACIFGESFAYLGYTVKSEADFKALLVARTHRVLRPDGKLPSTYNPGTVFPLREGVERFLVTDINGPDASIKSQSPIPVLVEIATWKYKKSEGDFKGTNVLYMDGHVAFVPLGTFPVLPSILDSLSGG